MEERSMRFQWALQHVTPRACRIEEVAPDDHIAIERLLELYTLHFPESPVPADIVPQILALNQNQRIQKLYGPYREVICVVRLWDDGPIIGGHVFGITSSASHHAVGLSSSVQAIYSFIDPEYRGHVTIRELAEYSRAFALKVFQPAENVSKRPMILCEVNNPLKMSEAEIAKDLESTGVDPYRRYMLFLRSGFKPLDFSYVQPRLTRDSFSVHHFDLFCIDEPTKSLPAELLLNHLEAFVSISILGGDPAEGDPDFRRMKTSLLQMGNVPLRSPDTQDVREIVRRGTARRGSGR